MTRERVTYVFVFFSMMLVAVLAMVALSGCGITEYQRFKDRVDAARADLNSPAMNKAICDAGAMTKACGR